MDKDWEEKFTFYAVSLYRVGNYTDSALVGTILFEKAVYTLLKAKKIDKSMVKNTKGKDKGELQHAIDLLCDNYKEYSKSNLHSIRKNVRNNIIHDELEVHKINRDDIEPMLVFIWEVFSKAKYEKYSGNINSIDFLTADYAVVDIREKLNGNLQDELAKKYSFHAFTIKDFQELDELRKQMISLGSRLKKELLKVQYKDELLIDILSKVDTTSAYVWMSMNLYDEDDEDDGERRRINSASASILGTPLDLRIYFDIGGGAYEVRQDYYKFLQSDCFKNFQENRNIDDLEIFDNDWYCFIIERCSLSKLKHKDIQQKCKEAEDKLAKYSEDDKISWNRMLCGYILNRGTISYENIVTKLEIIIELYYCFEYFRKHKLGNTKIKLKYDIGRLCKEKIRKASARFTEEQIRHHAKKRSKR